ncbi:SusC/RagA family TonB-linked outer membrane protein [Sphingobacterium sp. DK4209]|uniref:SusC/RagA family TonB-linked outer membrane protein n=1 Tax=Sphingobacterium zhuxiongii TaxID=2662364 RepID=A0A5Q0Q9R2_9SPHI|nr:MULTISPECIES: SusC/RagA family TonB-linked outer membrane protein [unclassified Sphingobacterium]MVZ64251.1 SusC/RagA family TonB-linked outer membrane protein [Sphingobacterium sp. DK4209]QGA25601.1 SusC/RagA family TonB-linked outer membrane protein [Sphingobacterium sp. dk4302]
MKHHLLTSMCVMACASIQVVNAQQIAVAGKVSDQNGAPLSGVTVTVKGTSISTASNDNGLFTLNADHNATLVFTAVGYQTQEIAVAGRKTLNVTLNSGDQVIDEVVVTALGIQRSEKSLGYSTQKVSGDDLTFTKDNNVLGSLAGKVAGAQVTGSSGASLGGTQKIKIRGINSVTGGGQPLMVIDGTPISNANFSSSNGNGVDLGNVGQDINPEDVESINVLKGPAASALYGLRGQYGVIMITTKKGKKGPKSVSVDLNSATSFEQVGNFMPLQNIYGVGNNQNFLKLGSGELYVNGNDESWGPKMDGTPVRMYYSFYPQDADYGKTTAFLPQPDNIKDFFQTGLNTNNGLTISGGAENSSIRFSYNNTYIKGTYPNTWLKRNNFAVNGSLDITSKLTASANINYANNKGQRPVMGYQGSFTGATQWFQRNIDINRLRNYRYEDGTIMNWNVNPVAATGLLVNNTPSDWNNPFFDAYENLNNDSRDRIFGDIGLTYQVLPELKLSGFIRKDQFTQNTSRKLAFGGRSESGTGSFLSSHGYSVGKFQNDEMNYEFLATYDKRWNDLTLNANVGGNIYNRQYDYLTQKTQGGLSSPGFFNIEGSIDRPLVESYSLKKQIRSFYAMASLGYKDTYFLDASIRRDISSTLPKENNSYWYPSVSGSFVFSNLLEPSFLSFGKLRASYAVAGADVDPFDILLNYNVGSVYASTTQTIPTLTLPDILNNVNLKPSFAHSYEVGMDLKFLKNRLGIDFTYYQQRNKDQVISLTTPSGTGYSKATVNAGDIENNGIEVSIHGTPVKNENFSWNMTLNGARNNSKIHQLIDGIDSYELGSNTYSSQTVYLYANKGQAFGTLVGPGYKRDEATGKILLNASNLPIQKPNVDFGSVLPDFTGGFLNSFQYKNIDLNAMIDFQAGGQFFSWSKMLAVKSGQAEETAAINSNGKNVRDPLADGGGYEINGISEATGEEVNAFVDARTYFRNNIGTSIYEEWLYDASYIKLREVSLGYTFNKNQLGNSAFKAIRIAVIARNPWMIWQKAPKGLDPSELSSGSASISWIEKGELQTVRSYGFNLSVKF